MALSAEDLHVEVCRRFQGTVVPAQGGHYYYIHRIFNIYTDPSLVDKHGFGAIDRFEFFGKKLPCVIRGLGDNSRKISHEETLLEWHRVPFYSGAIQLSKRTVFAGYRPLRQWKRGLSLSSCYLSDMNPDHAYHRDNFPWATLTASDLLKLVKGLFDGPMKFYNKYRALQNHTVSSYAISPHIAVALKGDEPVLYYMNGTIIGTLDNYNSATLKPEYRIFKEEILDHGTLKTVNA